MIFSPGFYQFTTALSAALGQAFVSLSDDPLLVWNYVTVAIIAFCGGIAFWLFFRKWDQQEEKLNMLPESKFRGKNLGGEEKTIDRDEEDVVQEKGTKTLHE
jgi:proton-dependent oligopeptide transporter, POT family